MSFERKLGHYNGRMTSVIDDSSFTDSVREATLQLESRVPGLKLDLPSPHFDVTPKKPNFARLVARATLSGYEVGTGDFFIIVFMPGDGTGVDDGGIEPGSYVAPQNVVKATKTNPKYKNMGILEAHFALGTVFGGEKPSELVVGAGSLALIGQDIGLDGSLSEVKVLGDLGMTAKEFATAKKDRKNGSIPVTYTLFPEGIGEVRGKNHACYNPYADAVQVAGFLAVGRKDLGVLLNLGAGFSYDDTIMNYPRQNGRLRVGEPDRNGAVRLDLVGTNPNGVTMNHLSEMQYSVANGSRPVEFWVDGATTFVHAGESIVIPVGTPYVDKSHGNSVMTAVATPPFDASAVEHLRLVG